MKRERRTPTRAEMVEELKLYPESPTFKGEVPTNAPTQLPPDSHPAPTQYTVSEPSEDLKAAEENLKAVEKELEEPEKLTWGDEKPSEMPISSSAGPEMGPTPASSANFIVECIALLHGIAAEVTNYEGFELSPRLRAQWDRIIGQFAPTDLKKLDKYLPYLGIAGLILSYGLLYKGYVEYKRATSPPSGANTAPKPLENAGIVPAGRMGKPRGM